MELISINRSVITVNFSYFSVEKPKYKDDDTINYEKNIAAAEALVSFFKEFAKGIELNHPYHINYSILGMIIRKVNRRLAQFKIFDDYGINNSPSELKEAALYAFWINKLKPFTLLPNEDGKNSHLAIPLNEIFARVLIFCTLRGRLAKENSKVDYAFDERLNSSMVYAFRFWDFTKESFIFIVESLYYQIGKADAKGKVN